MVTLRRTVRFCINPPGATEDSPPPCSPSSPQPSINGFGGKPPMHGLGRYYELDITCQGDPDPTTGYLLSIREIDAAAHAVAVPLIAQACADRPLTQPAALLPEIFSALSTQLPGYVAGVRWHLTPTYSVEMPPPPSQPLFPPPSPSPADSPLVLLRQRFDFAAAHRLHSPHLSDAENRDVFGRCNNPSGHGHNYQVEPAVEIAPADAAVFTLAALERITHDTLIDRYDHTHLNLDTPDFSSEAGLNPSVENIARVFYERLAPAIEQKAGGKARLRSITVWETDRTSCTFPARDVGVG